MPWTKCWEPGTSQNTSRICLGKKSWKKHAISRVHNFFFSVSVQLDGFSFLISYPGRRQWQNQDFVSIGIFFVSLWFEWSFSKSARWSCPNRLHERVSLKVRQTHGFLPTSVTNQDVMSFMGFWRDFSIGVFLNVLITGLSSLFNPSLDGFLPIFEAMFFLVPGTYLSLSSLSGAVSAFKNKVFSKQNRGHQRVPAYYIWQRQNYNDLTWPHQKGSWGRDIPLFQGNLGRWNLTIWPDYMHIWNNDLSGVREVRLFHFTYEIPQSPWERCLHGAQNELVVSHIVCFPGKTCCT